jgi:hypothetical protein
MHPASIRSEDRRSLAGVRRERPLDAALAELYSVETKALVRAVRRNVQRFPADFMFRIAPDEFELLRYQIGTSSSRGRRRHRPYAFTALGVAMLSSALERV